MAIPLLHRSLRDGVEAPGRAPISARTFRTDRWWLAPVLTFTGLALFIVYATFRAFEGRHYFVEPLLSPFYSPCLAVSCVPGSAHLGTPIGAWWVLSPALLILVFPLGFRLTCYYYRKAYYRAFWLSPPACAVAEPHAKYSGETRFPLIMQNSHRVFWYIGLVFNVLLTYDAVVSLKNAEGEWGHLSLGSIVLATMAGLLWLYSLSCHTCRHVVGGRLKHFSRHPVRYRMWTWVSRLNGQHMAYAWWSLLGVVVADLYVRSVAVGWISNPYFF